MLTWRAVVAIWCVLLAGCQRESDWGGGNSPVTTGYSYRTMRLPTAQESGLAWLTAFLYGYARASGGKLPRSWSKLESAMGSDICTKLFGEPLHRMFLFVPRDFKVQMEGRPSLLQVILVEPNWAADVQEPDVKRVVILQDPDGFVFAVSVAEAEWQAAVQAHGSGQVARLRANEIPGIESW